MIAIIAPDNNRAVAKLRRGSKSRRVFMRNGDWPFRFERIYVCRPSGWRGFAPDDLPAKYW